MERVAKMQNEVVEIMKCCNRNTEMVYWPRVHDVIDTSKIHQ